MADENRVKASPGGMIALYGVAIGDALYKGASSSDAELLTLRENAKSTLAQYGDVKRALDDLEAEIARRGVETKDGPVTEHTFLVQISGFMLGSDKRRNIEKKIASLIASEMASVDTKGAGKTTAFSDVNNYGADVLGAKGIPGGGTMGLVYRD